MWRFEIRHPSEWAKSFLRKSYVGQSFGINLKSAYPSSEGTPRVCDRLMEFLTALRQDVEITARPTHHRFLVCVVHNEFGPFKQFIERDYFDAVDGPAETLERLASGPRVLLNFEQIPDY
jgi:hypothetical protein